MKKLFELENYEKSLIILFVLSMASIFTSLFMDGLNYEKIKYYENDKIPINFCNGVKKLGYSDYGYLYATEMNGDSIYFQSAYNITEATKMYSISRLNIIKSNSDFRSKEFVNMLSYESDKMVSSLFFWIGYFLFVVCIIVYFVMKCEYYDFDIMCNSQVSVIGLIFLSLFAFSLILF